MAWKKENSGGAQVLCDLCGVEFVISFEPNDPGKLMSTSVFVDPSLPTDKPMVIGECKDGIYLKHVCQNCRESLYATIQEKIAALSSEAR